MANSVEEILAEKDRLEARLRTFQNKAAVAEADEARIKKELALLLKELKDKFGCASYEEAVELRDSLLEEYQKKVMDLEEKLNALGSV